MQVLFDLLAYRCIALIKQLQLVIEREFYNLIHTLHLDSFYIKFDRSPLLELSFEPNSLAFAQDYADWSCTTSQQYPYGYARQK